MLIDLNGNPKKMPKKKKEKRLSEEAFLEAFEALATVNTDCYCLFYRRDGEDYKFFDCSQEQLNAFIALQKRHEIEEIAYGCIGSYFEEDTLDTLDAQEINELQDWIEDFIKRMIEEQNKNDED